MKSSGQEREEMKPYILGLDGGGTKTAVCAIDKEGNELFRLSGGAMNLNGESSEKVIETIRELITSAAGMAGEGGELAAVGIGAAGISNPSTEKVLRLAVKEAGFEEAPYLTGDHMAALAGALGTEEGILVIAGTGSICIGRSADGRQARVGGRGHLIDDEGSGYAIGRDILRAVTEASDGRRESTGLTKLVYERLQIGSIEELVAYVYRPGLPKSEIAKLAELLSCGCGIQDRAALEIAEKAAEQLVRLILAAVSQLELNYGKLALAGSVLLKNEWVKAFFVKGIADKLPGFTVIQPAHDAAYGAALLAKLHSLES